MLYCRRRFNLENDFEERRLQVCSLNVEESRSAATNEPPCTLCCLAHHLYNEGKNEEARAWYEQALRIAPDYAEAHNNLGLTLDALGRQNEATSHFLEALRINPSLAEAHNGLGKVYFQQGKFDVALRTLQSGTPTGPGICRGAQQFRRNVCSTGEI